MKVIEWARKLLEKPKVDCDGYPKEQIYQCHDVILKLKEDFKLNKWNTYCDLTGNTVDNWSNRNINGASNYFDFINDKTKLKNGDIVFMFCDGKGHVGIYDNSFIIGQNQPYPYVTKTKLNYSFLGAFRMKGETQDMFECFNKLIECKQDTKVRNGYSLKSKVVGSMKKGETGHITDIMINDGYVWVRWKTGNWSAIAESWYK